MQPYRVNLQIAEGLNLGSSGQEGPHRKKSARSCVLRPCSVLLRGYDSGTATDNADRAGYQAHGRRLRSGC